MFSNELVINILNYLNRNLYRKISMDEISAVFSYNKDYIMRRFKSEIGISITNYLNRKRIYNSLKSYSDKTSILNIALSFGFYSQEYYSEIFNKVMGVSPSTYRNFIKTRFVSIHNAYIIQENLAFLDYEFRKIDEYMKNIPPKKTKLVLSIFK